MGLFKSKDERRIEREMKIRAGLLVDRAVDSPAGKVRRGLCQKRPARAEDRRSGAIRVHPQRAQAHGRREKNARAAIGYR